MQYEPNDGDALAMLGEAALASQDSAAAASAFERLLGYGARSTAVCVAARQGASALQDWPAALAAFRVLDVEPEHAEALQAVTLVTQLQARLNVLVSCPESTVGRNDPVPTCGSGLKYKKCCLEKSSQYVLHQRFVQALAASDWQQVISLAQVCTKSPATRRAVAMAHYQLSQRELAYPLLKVAYQEQPDDNDLRAAYCRCSAGP